MFERLRSQPQARVILAAVVMVIAVGAYGIIWLRDDESEATASPTHETNLESTPELQESAISVQQATSTVTIVQESARSTTTPDESRAPPPPGSLYIVDRGTSEVRVFSPDGEALFSWGAPAPDAAVFDTPAEVAVGAGGEIYLLEHEIADLVQLAADGRSLVARYPAVLDSVDVVGEADLAVTSGGGIFVLDRSNSRVLSFGTSGEYRFAWGQPGDRLGFFESPRQLLARGDDLYVLESTGRIQTFDELGRLQDVFEPESGSVVQAAAMTPLAAGGFAIVDSGAADIAVMAEDGNSLRTIPLDAGVAPAGVVELNRDLFVLDTAGSAVLRAGDGSEFQQIFSDPDSMFASMTVAPDGTLLLVDSRRPRIVRLARDGAVVEELHTAGSEPGRFSSPWGVGVSASGDVYVSDVALDRLQRFGPTGNLLDVWGSNGSEPGQFDEPRGVAVDGEGFVYVADSGNNRVQKFTGDGEFVASWGDEGDRWDLDRPFDVAVDADGNLYIVDTGNNRIHRIGDDGEHVDVWGARGFGNGFFNRPNSIAIHDVAGRVYVADTGNRRIQMLSLAGEYAGQWGSAPSTADLAVTAGDRLLVISVEPDPRNRVRRYDIDGNFLIVRDRLVLETELLQPVSIALSPP